MTELNRNKTRDFSLCLVNCGCHHWQFVIVSVMFIQICSSKYHCIWDWAIYHEWRHVSGNITGSIHKSHPQLYSCKITGFLDNQSATDVCLGHCLGIICLGILYCLACCLCIVGCCLDVVQDVAWVLFRMSVLFGYCLSVVWMQFG